MTDNSDFEKFGIVHHTKETKIPDFIKYLESGKIMATRCKDCGVLYFPPKADCPKCFDSGVEWVEIKKPGKLVTYTVVNYGPTGFEDRSPYILGLAQFEEGIKVLALMADTISQEDIQIGIDVRLAVAKRSPDCIIYNLEKV